MPTVARYSSLTPDEEVNRVFGHLGNVSVHLCSLDTDDLFGGMPDECGPPWEMHQAAVYRKHVVNHKPKLEQLLLGKFMTGAVRAYQSVLRMLSLLPDRKAIDPERSPVIPSDFAIHNIGSEVCTACARRPSNGDRRGTLRHPVQQALQPSTTP